MAERLTKVGSSVWVMPSDVVRIYETPAFTSVLDGETKGPHVYLVLHRAGVSSVLFDGPSPSEHYQVTDWPVARVERALGLRRTPDPVASFVEWLWTKWYACVAA